MSWQELGHDGLAERSLTLADAHSSVWWVGTDGRPVAAHLAVASALQATEGWPRWCGRVVALPGIRGVASIAYRVVARHRHRLPGGTPACKLGSAA